MKTLNMPRVDPTMEKGVVLRWLKKEGEPVKKGDLVAVVLAEKVEYEYTSPYEGRIGRILATEGEELPVGKPLVEILEPGERPESLRPGKIEVPPASTEILASPAARRLARERGVDLSKVKGTGPGGRITSEDTVAFLESQRAQTVPPSLRLSPVMRVVAEKMMRSHREIPSVTIFTDVFMDRVWELKNRKEVSIDACVIFAVSRALKKFPKLNGEYRDGAVVLKPQINVAFAAAVGEELYSPVVKNSVEKTLEQISAEVAVLVEKVKAHSLSLEEIRDATFTISNLGPFGIEAFTPIILPGQTAILGVGAIKDRSVPREEGVLLSRVATFCLAFDHRVLNGATAAAFLAALKDEVEKMALD